MKLGRLLAYVAGISLAARLFTSAVGKNRTMKQTASPTILTIPGFRRAKQSEVTAEMTAAAKRALSNPLGTILNYGHFAVGIETHSNAPKGASIFLPISNT